MSPLLRVHPTLTSTSPQPASSQKAKPQTPTRTSTLPTVAAGVEDAEARLAPRKPYVPVTDAVKVSIKKMMENVAEIEKSL